VQSPAGNAPFAKGQLADQQTVRQPVDVTF
jgi:hypothetical protein